MAAVAQPHYGSNHPGSSNVTLTISSAQGGGGSTIYRRPQHHHHHHQQHNGGQFRQFNAGSYPQDILMGDGPGRRLRKNVANVRRHVDYVSNILNHADARLWQYGRRQRLVQQPDELYQNSALPAWCTPDVPVDCVLTKFVRAAMNKVKCPVYTLCWTPEGKRLITGASTGEFTLWNGTAFNFETILQAHDSAIRAMTWSYNEQWLVSADHDGYIKYWQPNMNNVHMFQAHKDDPIRGLSFAPTDVKLASASDDGTARIWDFARCSEERVLRGHGSEVRCIDWHPTKGLLVTGSRDAQQPVKLWDPKSGQCLSTLQDHKSSVMCVEWNRNGNWLLTGGRDHLIKLYDIRIMKEMHTFRGHKKEVTSVAWNPVHENLFVSGSGDGSLSYWLVGSEKEVGLLEHAHDQAVWAMKFHPKGHILSTGSNDNNTKFWARNRPGDTQEDIFGLASFTTNMVGSLDKEREPKAPVVRVDEETALNPIIPGMGLDEDVYENMNREISSIPSSANSVTLLMPDDLNSRQQAASLNARRVLIKQPPPKKAQRQFERMWNVSKPGGDESAQDEDAFRRPKASLLGAPPPPSMLSSQQQTMSPQTQQGPPPGMPPPAQFGAPGRPPLVMPPGWKPGQTALRPPGPPPPGYIPRGMPPPPSTGTSTSSGGAGGAPPPRAMPPPPFPFPAGMPPGMWPPPPGMLPPGMPMPPAVAAAAAAAAAAAKKQHQDTDMGVDIDYRSSGQPSGGHISNGGGADVDLRSAAPSSTSSVRQNLPPPMTTTSDSWRSHDNQGHSAAAPAPAVHDPRMRKQQQQQPPEEIRDPRRRQPPPDQSRGLNQSHQQQQDGRASWMPQISNYSQKPPQQPQQDHSFDRQQDYSDGYGQGDYDDRQSGYNGQQQQYGGGKVTGKEFGGGRGGGGRGGGAGGQWRGRGRGRPY